MDLAGISLHESLSLAEYTMSFILVNSVFFNVKAEIFTIRLAPLPYNVLLSLQRGKKFKFVMGIVNSGTNT